MQVRRGRFTVAEDRVLLQKYALVPISRLAATLNRSPLPIRQRAETLFALQPMKRGPWSPEDTAQLKTYYGASPEDSLQLVLRRYAADIEAMVAKLKRKARGQHGPLSRLEIVQFKRWYSNRKIEALSIVFGREAAMLEELAVTLCLKKDKAFIRSIGGASKMPRWTATEVVALRREYPDASNTELAQQLGRSVKSVVSKAHNLQLKKSPRRLEEMGRQNVRGRYDR